MSAPVLDEGPWPPPTAPRAGEAVQPATFGDVVLSEWTKLRTLRSTFFTLAAAVVLVVGLGALISYEVARNGPPPDLLVDPTRISLSALNIGQLAIAVLGVLVVTNEYSSGMIRASLAAVPHRGRLLAAKAIVFGVVAVITGEVVAWAAFSLGQAVMSAHLRSAHLSDPGVVRAVIGAGLYVALVGLMAVAIGAILRHTAGSIVTVVAILFVLPGIILALPESWRNPVEKFWPTEAGRQVSEVVRQPHTLAAWPGFLDLAVFVALLMVLALYLLKRRDA